MRLVLAAYMVLQLGLLGCSDKSSAGGSGTDAPTAGAFESFRRTSSAGPCPADSDCSGFVELDADGTLLFDRFDELPVMVHEAQVTAEERDHAIDALTAAALVTLLDLGEPPCTPPSDVFESMTLEAGGSEHRNDVTFCDDPPLVAARAALDQLTQAYFP